MVKGFISPRHIRVMVVDEADNMIQNEKGGSGDVTFIRKMLPPECQIMMFSAT
jgi:superfamily II DNA/RNA helicase